MRRGFTSLQQQMVNKGRYIASCNSCADYFTIDTDVPESCQNRGVTKFDMANADDGRTYCTYWRSVGQKGDRG